MRLSIDASRPVSHHKLMRKWLVFSLLCSGCASLSTQLPELDAAKVEARQMRLEASAFDKRDKHLARLMDVSSQVLSANADLCEKTRPHIGAVTHRLKSYDKALRPAAARESAAMEDPTVLYVMPGSPADDAGLQAGDVLLHSGKPVSGSHAGFLEAAKNTGTVAVRRSGEVTEFQVKPAAVCGYRVRLRMTPVINAYADGKNITVTTGMMEFTASDDELALIIGHELAHNTHGHIRKIITNAVLTGYSKRHVRPFEAEADYVGMYYMTRAGYDLSGIEDFWDRLARANPKYIAKDYTHPAYPRRAELIAATRAEIKAKQAAGDVIIPNQKAGS